MQTVLFSQNKNIATITLNAPEQLNAITEEMAVEFKKIIQRIKKSLDIRAVIITGAGRAFSSGGNLEMLEEKFAKGTRQNHRELKKFYKIFLAVRELPQPVIAAINGHAVGAGLCLALACDLRYASATAKLVINFTRLGLPPGMGATHLLTRLLGTPRAAEVFFRAQTLTAEQACQWGLINQVYRPSTLLQNVMQIAAEISQNAPLALRHTKKGIYLALDKPFHQMMDFDAMAQAQCFATRDCQEGITATREKRAPKFIGK